MQRDPLRPSEGVSQFQQSLPRRIVGNFVDANFCKCYQKLQKQSFATKPCIVCYQLGCCIFQRFLFLQQLDCPRKLQKFALCKNFPLYHILYSEASVIAGCATVLPIVMSMQVQRYRGIRFLWLTGRMASHTYVPTRTHARPDWSTDC